MIDDKLNPMSNILMIIIFVMMGGTAQSQILKGISIYYHDNQTVPGKDVYREFTGVKESPFWSKPHSLDIKLSCFNYPKNTNANNQIEIIIDELYGPTPFAKAT